LNKSQPITRALKGIEFSIKAKNHHVNNYSIKRSVAKAKKNSHETI
jgi:hypothetical protein